MISMNTCEHSLYSQGNCMTIEISSSILDAHSQSVASC